MFIGAYTAIITPFNSRGGVDYEVLRRLVEFQIENGIDGLVPVGTTGESPTVDYEEHKKIIETVVAAASRRVKIIAGTGGNSTAEAVELTKFAVACGADATLQVTPYYNKPNQEGLYRHFSVIADLGLPVVLYNVPGRTAVEISEQTVARLARHPNIAALKEAGGSVQRVSRILDECDITVLSGDDALTLPMMIVGAKGVISVASNIAPKAVSDMVRKALDGEWAAAAAMHRKLFRLFTDLFIDTNPIPIKAAMAMAGLAEETYRLPLCPMDEKRKQKLAGTLKGLGIIS